MESKLNLNLSSDDLVACGLALARASTSESSAIDLPERFISTSTKYWNETNGHPKIVGKASAGTRSDELISDWKVTGSTYKGSINCCRSFLNDSTTPSGPLSNRQTLTNVIIIPLKSWIFRKWLIESLIGISSPRKYPRCGTSNMALIVGTGIDFNDLWSESSGVAPSGNEWSCSLEDMVLMVDVDVCVRDNFLFELVRGSLRINLFGFGRGNNETSIGFTRLMTFSDV